MTPGRQRRLVAGSDQPDDLAGPSPLSRPPSQPLTAEQEAELDALAESAPFPDPQTLQRLKALMPLWRRRS